MFSGYGFSNENYFEFIDTLQTRDPEASDENNPLVDLNGMPDSMVGGCVNAITGSYSESTTDIYIPSSNPLFVNRYYNSNNKDYGTLMHGWDLNLRGGAAVSCSDPYRTAFAKYGPSFVTFEGRSYLYRFKFLNKQLRYGVTNCVSGMLSAKNNIKNLRFYGDPGKSNFCELYQSSYEKLLFRKYEIDWQNNHYYHLFQQYFPNGCHYEYNYSKKNVLNKISSLGSTGDNLGELNFIWQEKFEKNPIISIKTSQGDTITYKFQKMQTKSNGTYRYCLKELDTPLAPKQTFEYKFVDKKFPEKIVKSTLPDGRGRHIEYYEKNNYSINGDEIKISKTSDSRFGRVFALKLPIGLDATPLPMYRFIYHLNKDKASSKPIGGMTEVYDPYDNKMAYHFCDEQRLTKIESFNKDGSLYRSENITWGSKKSDEYTLLKNRQICDSNGNILLAKEYKYDKKGNVIEEKTSGNLKGLGTYETHTKYYSYTIANQISLKMTVFNKSQVLIIPIQI